MIRKLTLALGVVLAISMGLAAPSVAAERYVQTGMVCDYNTTRAQFDLAIADYNTALAQAQLDVQGGYCTTFPGAYLEVKEVILPFASDSDGDRMVILRVGKDAYTIGWLGQSTNVIEPASFSI